MQNNSLKNLQGITCVIGVDWGDAGKGRLIDDLASSADVIARFAGGSNTGHTVENEFGNFKFHIMPSGICNQKAINLIGRNVAVNLESLTAEMKQLDKAKVSYKNLIIDENATLTMPWHLLRDGIREKMRDNKIGTTNNGVGPTYADRTERVGLLVADLIADDFKQKLASEIEIQNKFYNLKLKTVLILKTYQKYTEKIAPYIGKTIPLLHKYIKQNKNILFEGAQGWLLDLDAGTYPFVTSSNPGVIGISRCYEFHPSVISNVIGITKAYNTRVGGGPMPTLITGSVANHIVTIGGEIGTTTGRVRDPGWLDLVLLKKASIANGVNALAITKLDVLSGLKTIKLCIKYRENNKAISYVSTDAKSLSSYKPVYKELKGWQDDITKVRKFSGLPRNAISYIKTIEEITGIPVKFISVGPKRGEVIWLD